jgi:hypothetical protein
VPRSPSIAPAAAQLPDYKPYIRLVAGATACLCMLLIVGIILYAIVNQTISTAILGDYKTGAGLIGVLVVTYKVIAKVLA